MPTITMQSSKLSGEVKERLIEKLTSAASEVTSVPEEYFTIFFDEYEIEAIGHGGRPLSEMINK